MCVIRPKRALTRELDSGLIRTAVSCNDPAAANVANAIAVLTPYSLEAAKAQVRQKRTKMHT